MSKWLPIPEPGAAGGFFLLKGSFPFPLFQRAYYSVFTLQ